jgi:two-component system response regulator CpxR
MSMRSLLIVDDDVKLCAMLHEYLAQHGFAADLRHDFSSGMTAARSNSYDLMLLDVMLPEKDGFEFLTQLRQTSNLLVLLLTARGHATDRIRGLQLGADDYLSKPFDPEELVARIRAILRRAPMVSAQFRGDEDLKRTSTSLKIDVPSRTVTYAGNRLDLTEIEISLLDIFLQCPGIVLTREELVSRVFNKAFHPLDRSLDMHICRLRKKLSAATSLASHIKTIRSSGYLFSTIDVPL